MPLENEWSVGVMDNGSSPQHSSTPLPESIEHPMSEIHFVDTTLRDGQQSLWALGMKTGTMLPIAAQMDRVGFESMEFFVSIMIKKYVREHKENPWIWLREGTKRFSHTRLRNTAACTAPARLK